MQNEILEWLKVIGPLILSWPVVGLIAVIIFRKPLYQVLHQLGSSELRKAKIGPIEIEKELTKLAEQGQEAVSKLNRINELMAESRLLELEITDSMFSTVFTDQQRKRMGAQIDELRTLTKR